MKNINNNHITDLSTNEINHIRGGLTVEQFFLVTKMVTGALGMLTFVAGLTAINHTITYLVSKDKETQAKGRKKITESIIFTATGLVFFMFCGGIQAISDEIRRNTGFDILNI